MKTQINQNKVRIPYAFTPRNYQLPFLYEVQEAIEGRSNIRYFFQVWHRRSGKDKTNIAHIAPVRLIKDPCLVKYVYPTLVMGRDNMWNGIGSDGFKYLDHIPEAIRVGIPNKSRMTIDVRNTTDVPSIFQIAGSDNPDSLRGGNAKLYIFSEWAEQDPYAWDVIEPILRENDGIAIFNMTPKGNNHARALYEFARHHPKWYVNLLSAKNTDVFTSQQLDEILDDTIRRFEANGRSREEAIAYFEQEYLCSFESPVIGSYYGSQLMKAEKEGRITTVPYELMVPVDTFWDLGVDDSTTIWFAQTVGRQIRFIDYYENSGEGLAHYIQILQEKKYIYRHHYAPHDIQVRELGTGKSRLEMAKTLGVNFIPVEKLGIDDGINAGRSIFNQCWFDNIKCNRGINALKNYRKDWDEKNKVFRSTPLHDWSSHGADAFRTFAVGYGTHAQFVQNNDVGGVKPFYDGMPG